MDLPNSSRTPYQGNPEDNVLEITSSYLRSCRAAAKVAGDKEVDDGPADPLSGQDERQGPPETQHLPDGRVSLRREHR